MAERIVSMLLPPKIDPAETMRLGDAVRDRIKVTPPEMARIRHRASLYGVSAVDVHGRILARYLLVGLGWKPGDPLAFTERGDLLVVTADERGRFRLTIGGYLRLPATLRHWHGLEAGTRVLLVADPNEARLVIHPPASIDSMITQVYAGVFPGDAA